ncbi:hypothetical protein GIB67_000460 [Kingdonia uniflora]|uniref:RRM domain-containing protein n=1 Tax=Kingdonia uniflora TaxID=39325 RepID=A0A7J7L0B3_9MAGN|nr:hypothetical protein GIB67_000460 [Kingdonia uniflora]
MATSLMNPGTTISLSPKFLSFSKLSSSSINLHVSLSTPSLSFISPLFPSNNNNKKFNFEVYSTTVQEALSEEPQTETQEENFEEDKRKKLYVVNLPYTVSVTDIKSLFGECGTVKDVEVIKQKDGRNRGFAFITMASFDEARAVIDKFDSYEVSGRIIRVDFAKRYRKPSPLSTAGTYVETQHKLYVSNLAWKARSSHLRELFSESFSIVSARVVFDNPSGRSAGYGFVSFATKEEAETALSSLDGKELMGRPIRLKFSEKNSDGAGTDSEEGDLSLAQTQGIELTEGKSEESLRI